MEGYIVKHAFRHFLPAAILTGIIMQLRIITDGIIVSHLVGPDALSAINLYMPLEEAIYALLSIIALGASFLGAEQMGCQNYKRASHYFTVSLAGSGILVAAVVALSLLFFQPLVSVLAGSQESLVREYLASYLLYMLPTFLVMAPNNILRYFINIDGKPRLVTVSILTSFVLNPVLDIVLIRYAGAGVAGAAIATFVSDLAGLAVLVVCSSGNRRTFRLRMPADRMNVFRASVMSGIPLAASMFLLAILDWALNRIVFHFRGESGLYIWAVLMQVMSLCEMVIEGVSEMNQAIGGTMLGACDFQSFHAFLKRTQRFVVITLGAITVLLLAVPQSLFFLFGAGDDPSLNAEGCRCLRIVSVFLLPYFLVTFYENIHALVGRGRMALLFEVLQAGMMAAFPFVAGLIVPGHFWWAFPLLGTLLFGLQMWVGLRIQRRTRNVVAPFLTEVFPVDVEAGFDVTYDRASIDETMEKIQTLASILELPDGKEMRMVICCEELMNNLLARKQSEESLFGAFDIRVVDKPDLTQITFRAAGKPFNPITRFDEEAFVRFLSDEPVDLELEMVNKLCDHISHKYMFGVNFTWLDFKKA